MLEDKSDPIQFVIEESPKKAIEDIELNLGFQLANKLFKIIKLVILGRKQSIQPSEESQCLTQKVSAKDKSISKMSTEIDVQLTEDQDLNQIFEKRQPIDELKKQEKTFLSQIKEQPKEINKLMDQNKQIQVLIKLKKYQKLKENMNLSDDPQQIKEYIQEKSQQVIDQTEQIKQEVEAEKSKYEENLKLLDLIQSQIKTDEQMMDQENRQKNTKLKINQLKYEYEQIHNLQQNIIDEKNQKIQELQKLKQVMYIKKREKVYILIQLKTIFNQINQKLKTLINKKQFNQMKKYRNNQNKNQTIQKFKLELKLTNYLKNDFTYYYKLLNMSSLFGLIKFLDMFPYTIELNYDSHSKQRSYYGATMSIIFIATILTISINQILDYQKNLKYEIQELNLFNHEMMQYDIEKQNLMIGIINDQQLIGNDSYFTISLKQTIYYKQKLQNETEIQLELCQNSNEEQIFDNFKHFYCVKKNQPLAKLQGQYFHNQFQQLEIQIKKNQNYSGNFTFNNGINILKIDLKLIFSQKSYELDFQNFMMPMKETIKQNIFFLSSDQMVHSDIFNKRVQVVSTNYNLYKSIVFSDTKQQDYMFQENNQQLQYTKQENNTVAKIQIAQDQHTTQYIRKYQKFLDIISSIGGIIKIMEILGFFLVYWYNKYLFKVKLINCMYDINIINDNKKIHDKDIQNNYDLKYNPFYYLSCLKRHKQKRIILIQMLNKAYQCLDIVQILRYQTQMDHLKQIIFCKQSQRIFQNLRQQKLDIIIQEEYTTICQKIQNIVNKVGIKRSSSIFSDFIFNSTLHFQQIQAFEEYVQKSEGKKGTKNYINKKLLKLANKLLFHENDEEIGVKLKNTKRNDIGPRRFSQNRQHFQTSQKEIQMENKIISINDENII